MADRAAVSRKQLSSLERVPQVSELHEWKRVAFIVKWKVPFLLGNCLQIYYPEHDELDFVRRLNSENGQVSKNLMVKHYHGAPSTEVSAYDGFVCCKDPDLSVSSTYHFLTQQLSQPARRFCASG